MIQSRRKASKNGRYTVILFVCALIAVTDSFGSFGLTQRNKISFRHTLHNRNTPFCVDNGKVKELALHSSEDNEASGENSLPQLPAIGSSSFDPSSHNATEFSPSSGESAVVSEKFELRYTCKICETSNSNLVSRVAYRTGVVIAVCRGCGAKHLIADNLGWHNYIGGFEGDKNIEEYMASKGLEDSVNRVSTEVFELEKMLGVDSASGSIVGDGGELAME